MSRCPVCGMEVSGEAGICMHHLYGHLSWPLENRIMCDFFHRGIEPVRVIEPGDEIVTEAA